MIGLIFGETNFPKYILKRIEKKEKYIIIDLTKKKIFKKDKNSDMFSFSRSLSRVLKKYIKDGTEASSEHCPSCESKRLIYQDGCVQCQECGWSGCS